MDKPRREKPEGALPDLEEVQGEVHEREAPAAIPSTMRAPKVPHEPWNGRRVGDHEPPGRKDQGLRAHAKRRFVSPPPTVLDDQFVQNFFTWTDLQSRNSRQFLSTTPTQVDENLRLSPSVILVVLQLDEL